MAQRPAIGRIASTSAKNTRSARRRSVKRLWPRWSPGCVICLTRPAPAPSRTVATHVLRSDDPAPLALATLPDSLTRLFCYWQAKRGGRAMPARADIDPAEIKALLPYMILVDVIYDTEAGLDFVYRLVGTREVEI